MKKGFIYLSVAAMLPGPIASAQWVPTNGPYGGDVRSIAVIASSGRSSIPAVYVGTYGGGVFTSADGGTHWTGANTGLDHPAVSALAVSFAGGGSEAVTLFAATCGGVYRSTDQGASWSDVNTGVTNLDVRSLAVSPANGGIGTPHILAGTAGSGIYLSTDNGASWVPAGVANACINSLVANGTMLFAGEPSPTSSGGG